MRIDVQSLRATFPNQLKVPARLEAFAAWVKNVPTGSVGHFDAIAGDSLEESGLLDEAGVERASEKMGLFLWLPDGSRLALCDFGENARDAVVLLSSEGEHRTIAASLDSFLIKLSKGATDIADLDENSEPSKRPELSAWLKTQGLEAPRKEALPDFESWLAEAPSAAKVKALSGGFDLTTLCASLETLIGRSATDPAVQAFLLNLGYWPLPKITEATMYSLYLPHQADGYCLLFKDEKPAPRFEGCFFFSTAEEGYTNFKPAMPGGVKFGETVAEVVARLGPPENEILGKKTGRVTSQRWRYSTTNSLSVSYKEGLVKQLYLSS